MKSIFTIVDMAFIALVILFFVTQVAIPGSKGTPFFPMFRERPKKVATKVAEVTEERELDAIEKSAGLKTDSKSTGAKR